MKCECGVDRKWTLIGIVLLLSVRIAAADVSLPAEGTCASASCHSDLQQNPGAHDGNFEQQRCGLCHVSDASGEDHKFRYAASGGKLCTRCHANLTRHEYKHAPAAAGLCTFCHSAHATKYPRQLKLPPEALCVGCHNKTVPDGVRTVHGPVEQGQCTACHDPHSSGQQRQLVAAVPQLCFRCHNEDQTDHEGRKLPAVEQTFIDESLRKHPPFARGDCLLCHDPHASNNYRLQRNPYSNAFYTSFSSDKYFCLMCHGETIFAEPRTLTATKFRNGNLNLHYRHVDREKGRGCRSCHHQHASRLDALIATETYLGEQDIGIKAFAKTETGGTCEPSCHRPVAYDRLRPVDNVFMMTPREGVDATAAELRRAEKSHDGKTLFLQRCAGCHGADAQGKVGPPITGASLVSVIAATNRVDLMADLASLDPEDLHAIVDALPAGAPLVTQPRDSADGKQLYYTNCAGCHGADANGGVGPGVRGASSREIVTANDRIPMMIAMKSLDSAAIDSISEYLGGLAVTRDAVDGKAIYAINCSSCHGADASGQIGPSIRGVTTEGIDDAIGRVPMMAGLRELGSPERGAAGEFLASLEPVAASNVASRPADGKKIYAAECAGCHGADASGHIGPDIRQASAQDIRAAIDNVAIMIVNKGLDDNDIRATAAYIAALQGSQPE